MQQNNFHSIIKTWRERSGEIIEPSIVSMSGDNADKQVNKENDEVELIDSQRKTDCLTTATEASIVATAHNTEETHAVPEKFYKRTESSESTSETGDTDTSNDIEFKGKNKEKDKSSRDNDEGRSEGEEKGNDCKKSDDVDSVCLGKRSMKQPLPQHDQQPEPSEDNDWLVGCIYYTVVCCDCSIM